MELCWRARLSAAETTTADCMPAYQVPHLHNAIQDAICYLAKHAVIVCRQHATAVQNLDLHLRDYYNALKKLR